MVAHNHESRVYGLRAKRHAAKPGCLVAYGRAVRRAAQGSRAGSPPAGGQVFDLVGGVAGAVAGYHIPVVSEAAGLVQDVASAASYTVSAVERYFPAAEGLLDAGAAQAVDFVSGFRRQLQVRAPAAGPTHRLSRSGPRVLGGTRAARGCRR